MWRQRYVGMEASELKKVKQLEKEYAELALELEMQSCHRISLKPCIKRALVQELKELYPRGISKACRIFKMSRSSLCYQSVKADQVLMNDLSQLSKDHPRECLWKFYHRMRNAGHIFNRKRVHRVYVHMGNSIRVL